MSDGFRCTCAAYGECECYCGIDWKPKEVYELRQQLANALAANEQNLKVYHAAAAELRQQLAEKETQRQNLMTAYQRQGDSAQVVITELRQQLAQLQADLAETECRRRTLGEQLVEAQARLETSDGISRRNETIRLLDLDRAKLRQQLAKREKQIKLYEQALLTSWPEGAIGKAFDFWNAARILRDQGLDGPVPNLKPGDECGIRYVE